MKGSYIGPYRGIILPCIFPCGGQPFGNLSLYSTFLEATTCQFHSHLSCRSRHPQLFAFLSQSKAHTGDDMLGCGSISRHTFPI